MEEVWRASRIVPEYEVSDFGRVRLAGAYSQKRGCYYRGKPRKGRGKRPFISFHGKNQRISIMVCDAFHGPKPFPKAVAMHRDDDPTNNTAGNLFWGTQKENLNTPRFREIRRVRMTGMNNPNARMKLAREAVMNLPF
jgi:hypothetical protein